MTPTVDPPLAGRRALFVSWIAFHGRSQDLAAALGADCRFIAVGRLNDRRTALLRHVWQLLRTVALLLRARPRVLVVMAPPADLVLLGLLWRAVTRGRLVVDCHSKAVLGRPLSARLAAHADLAIVTLDELASGLPRAVVLHDPPARAVPAPTHDEVVFPASWYDDEPLADLLAAAAALPDVRFAITGTAPAGLQVPPNVRLTGFLPRADYEALVGGAPLVLALTTRESTMQRAAYEAVAAGRPLVASDTAALRSYLKGAAVYAGDLATAIRTALAQRDSLAAAAVQVRSAEERAFRRGLSDAAAAVLA